MQSSCDCVFASKTSLLKNVVIDGNPLNIFGATSSHVLI